MCISQKKPQKTVDYYLKVMTRNTESSAWAFRAGIYVHVWEEEGKERGKNVK